MFNLILAIDESNLVGSSKSKFGLPWHYPEDLKFYKEKTTNQKCVMGRSTYEAIGKALPNRETFVLTTNRDYHLDDATVIHSLEELDPNTTWWICGGVNVFKQCWDLADVIYITRIKNTYQGDVYFDDYDMSKFKLASSSVGENPELVFEKWVKNEDR